MYIKHKTTMKILFIVIIVMDIRFLSSVIASIYTTNSKSQIAFQSLSYSEYLQFFNSINF